MRFRPDASLRSIAGGRIVLGGSPLRLFRLTDAGRDLLRRATAGDDVDVTGASGRVLDRFVDAGALHPVPGPGRFGPGDVTVVVPVRDRVDGLDRLLASIEDAPPGDRPAAVVVVDDGSVDRLGHARVAAAHGADLVRRDRSGGPGVARNDGVARARTEVVAVLDSDATVDPGWLSATLGHLADERLAAVAVRVRTRPGPGVLARYEAARSPLDLGPDPGRVAPGTRISYVPAAGVVLRRSAFDDVGGYDPDLRVGEDVDLVWRLVGAGWRVRYEPSATIHHDVRPGPRAWLAQRVAYGTSAAPLDARHPGLVAPVACSPWTAAAWALAAAGQPVPAAVVALGSAAALPRKLAGVPTVEAVGLALQGHAGAGRQLSRAVVRVWWPVAVLAALRWRRARRLLLASAVAVVAEAWSDGPRPDLDPVAAAALTLADDAAYGAGVWVGCIRARSFRALLPRLVGWPARPDAAAAPPAG